MGRCADTFYRLESEQGGCLCDALCGIDSFADECCPDFDAFCADVPTTCENRCDGELGDLAPEFHGDNTVDGVCHCDIQCASRGDCCTDVATWCSTYPPPTDKDDSCAGFCGDQTDIDACWCDATCFQDPAPGNCCYDAEAVCTDELFTCANRCNYGYQPTLPSEACQCDSACASRGDCCADRVELCAVNVCDDTPPPPPPPDWDTARCGTDWCDAANTCDCGCGAADPDCPAGAVAADCQTVHCSSAEVLTPDTLSCVCDGDAALTSDDPNHCGGCGNVCAGTCTAGRCLTTLFGPTVTDLSGMAMDHQNGVLYIARDDSLYTRAAPTFDTGQSFLTVGGPVLSLDVDGPRVIFLTGDAGFGFTITAVDKANPGSSTTWTGGPSLSLTANWPPRLTGDADRVWVVDGTNGLVRLANGDNNIGNATQVGAAGAMRHGIVSDMMAVFGLRNGTGQIMVVQKATNVATVLGSDSFGATSRISGVALSPSHLCVSGQVQDGIYGVRCYDKATGAQDIVVADQPEVTGPLDVVGTSVFWGEQDGAGVSSSLYAAPVTGGAPTSLWAGPGVVTAVAAFGAQVLFAVVDGTNTALYLVSGPP